MSPDPHDNRPVEVCKFLGVPDGWKLPTFGAFRSQSSQMGRHRPPRRATSDARTGRVQPLSPEEFVSVKVLIDDPTVD